MTEIYRELAEALRERLELIADEASRQDPARHTEQLKMVSETLEQIERKLPPTIDPKLRHYLQRRSYSKALDFLQGKATS